MPTPRRLDAGKWIYGDWTITYNPKPIPASCGVDWDFEHKDYDGPEDRRCGNGPSVVDCLEQIRDIENA